MSLWPFRKYRYHEYDWRVVEDIGPFGGLRYFPEFKEPGHDWKRYSARLCARPINCFSKEDAEELIASVRRESAHKPTVVSEIAAQ